jgi:hypothetical protein
MKGWMLGMMVLLSGCTTAVSHAGKSPPEMRFDIRRCTAHGKALAPHDPIRALELAYRCLDELGYQRRTATAAR